MVILLSVRDQVLYQHHLINAISVEEEAWSWPNLRRRSRGFLQQSEQVRTAGAARTLQVGFKKELFPSNLLLSCVFGVFQISNPSCSRLSRPVRTRHRSTANWRASATMAFLRAVPVVS